MKNSGVIEGRLVIFARFGWHGACSGSVLLRITAWSFSLFGSRRAAARLPKDTPAAQSA